MISPTQQEHRTARERANDREPEPQRPTAQRRQETAAHQPHSEHAPAGLSATRRDEEASAATSDGNLFSMLMERDTSSLPGALHVAPHAAVTPHPAAAQESSGASAPMALWQPLENELDRALVNPPAGPVSVTLLLPRLGDVDARLQALPAGGWDIALRFAPAALDALAAHEERCHHSLRRRLACRVRLRFEQRGEWA